MHGRLQAVDSLAAPAHVAVTDFPRIRNPTQAGLGMMSAGHGQTNPNCTPVERPSQAVHGSRVHVCKSLHALALLFLFTLSGCARFPAIDPNGQSIFLPYPASTELTLPQVHAGNGNPVSFHRTLIRRLCPASLRRWLMRSTQWPPGTAAASPEKEAVHRQSLCQERSRQVR